MTDFLHQASVRAELDLVIWVETDEPTRLGRDAVRLAEGKMSAAGYSVPARPADPGRARPARVGQR